MKNTNPNSMIGFLESGSTEPPSNQHRWLIGIGSVLVAAIYVWTKLDQGWIAHDEGQLGQCAQRTFAGELPHRDFDEMYTGALSFLNALSFQIWGANSLSIRWMLFAWFVPFLASMYWLFSELTKPVTAGLLTLLAAAWSIPMYPAPMPSWYNLFFAGWVLCALMCFLKKGQRRYLLLAGLMIGGSILFKITGVFILAGTLLFLYFFRQTSRGEGDDESTSRLFSVLATIALLVAGSLSFVFVTSQDPIMQALHFVIPFLGLVAIVIFREWTLARGKLKDRVLDLVRDFTPLMIGIAIPMGCLVIYYWNENALGDLAYGILILPGKRIDLAALPFPSLDNLIFSVPIGALIFAGLWSIKGKSKAQPSKTSKSRAMLIGSIAMIAFLLMIGSDFGRIVGLMSFRNLGPILVLGNLALIFGFREKLTRQRQHLLYLVTVIPFFVSLIQFPYASPIYFFYAAPLLILTALIAVELQGRVPRKLLMVVVVFLILFSSIQFHAPVTGLPFVSNHHRVRLESERCQFIVDSKEAAAVNAMCELVAQHSSANDTVFTTPDLPEVNYLCNRRPFNGVMYEFFRKDLYADLEKLKDELASRDVRLVVINERPPFSPQVTEDFRTIALADYEPIHCVDFEIDDGSKTPRYTIYRRQISVSRSEGKSNIFKRIKHQDVQ